MPINIVPVNWPGIAIEPGQAERTELRLSSNHSFNTNQLQCSCHRHVRVHCPPSTPQIAFTGVCLRIDSPPGIKGRGLRKRIAWNRRMADDGGGGGGVGCAPLHIR